MEKLKSRTYFADEDKEIVVVELSGYIDQNNCDELDKLIAELKESGSYKLIFDFDNIDYMSSAGWGIVVGEVKSIREKGGDIKIANMSPEVYEVFQILEFYHIIQDYVGIESAVKSFSLGKKGKSSSFSDVEKILSEGDFESTYEEQNLDITGDSSEKETDYDDETNDFELDRGGGGDTNVEFVYKKDSNIDIKKLPLTEKIKKVVENYPLINIYRIKKMLKHDDFGNEKIGLFGLYSMLRKMNLHTKRNRYRYYRSC